MGRHIQTFYTYSSLFTASILPSLGSGPKASAAAASTVAAAVALAAAAIKKHHHHLISGLNLATTHEENRSFRVCR